ncbi:high frequency lysogenization protein HflD [Aquisalimonas lutea]|uniref:nickel/cobalt transporter n=1 Tax=Aquisalimonas lutea TaxID=1327750 RepID=UPI0025B2B791|nr:high frequency lysogenization protein HflD [Aquisalimonas lutea]MDN3519156.1 high frequency lysogenization protein HflD [Aquisalimonas lutea]
MPRPLLVLVMILVLAVPAGLAAASPLTGGDGTGGAAQDEPAGGETAERSLWQRYTGWIVAEQRALHRALTERVRALRNEAGVADLGALLALCFLYGLFHAAGPGHGKAVISTYLLTHRTRVLQGVTLSAAASLLQGVTAVVLVLALVHVAGWLSRDVMQESVTVELVSFGLIAGLGGLLTARAAHGLWRTYGAGTGEHGHGEGGGHCCGHHVMPEAGDGGGAWPAIGTVLAVGARPCTGAVLVLVAANLLGVWPAGIAAVIAMSAGTAMAVAALACAAVYARGWAGRMLSAGAGRWRYAGDVVALVGGAAICLLGVLLLIAALSTPLSSPGVIA